MISNNEIFKPRQMFLTMPLFLVVALLLLWPMLLLLLKSVQVQQGWGLGHYLDIFTVTRYQRALVSSLSLGALVALVSTLLCLAPAWLFVRYDFFGKRLVRAVLSLPMSFSGVIVGFLMVIQFGRAGIVPRMLEQWFGIEWGAGLAYQFSGLVLAYLYFEIPRATLTLETALRRLDPRVEDAARTLGANLWQRFFWVILPAILPALAATFAVTFSVSLGSFGVALILAVRGVLLLPLELFNQYLAPPTSHELAAAMGITLMVLAFAVNFGLRYWAERWESRHG
ncbi:ABC transporter permease [Kaarinaea lacus]